MLFKGFAGAKPSCFAPARVRSFAQSLELLVHLILCSLQSGLGVDLSSDCLVHILNQAVLNSTGGVEDVGVGLGVLCSLCGFFVGSLEDRVVSDLRRVGNELVKSACCCREDDRTTVGSMRIRSQRW